MHVIFHHGCMRVAELESSVVFFIESSPAGARKHVGAEFLSQDELVEITEALQTVAIRGVGKGKGKGK